MDVADLAAIHRRAGILGGNDPLGAARAGCSCAQGRDKIAPPRHRQSRGAGKASKCENAGAARPQETIAAVCRVRSGNQQQLADDAASFQQRMRTGAFAQRNAGGDRYLQVARNDAREQCIGARLSPLRGGQHVPQIAADQGQRAIHQPRGLCDNSEHVSASGCWQETFKELKSDHPPAAATSTFGRCFLLVAHRLLNGCQPSPRCSTSASSSARRSHADVSSFETGFN